MSAEKPDPTAAAGARATPQPETDPGLEEGRRGRTIILQAEERPEFWSGLAGAMSECAAGDTVILDLSGVSFLDSLAVGHLVTATRAKTPRLVLSGLRSEIFDVFKVTKLDQLFTIRESVSAAQREFG